MAAFRALCREQRPIRLDRWLRLTTGALIPQAAIERAIRKRRVRVEDATGVGLPATRVAAGTRLVRGFSVEFPEKWLSPSVEGAHSSPMGEDTEQLARLLHRNVLVVTHDLAVVNKPAGVASQPGGRSPSVVGALPLLAELLGATRESGGDGSALRLVHRLDQRVSGALLLARTRDAAVALSEALRAGAEGGWDGDEFGVARDGGSGGRPGASVWVRKQYLAVVCPPPNWALVAPGAGAPTSRAIPLSSSDEMGRPQRSTVRQRDVRACGPAGDPGAALLELVPLTGRKHQLRRLCAEVLRAPIVGDVRYGFSGGWRRRAGSPPRDLCLHSHRLVVRGVGDAVDVVAPPPPWLATWL